MPAMTRTRKPRRKATTDFGRSIMQRERQRLAKEQAELAEKLAEDAARSRRAATKRAKHVSTSDEASRAMHRSIVRRVAGVLSSEGVNVPIETEVLPMGQSIQAWTDFSRIHVGYHMHDDIKLTAAVLRGLFYHEGGHCRFTIPFMDLETLVAPDGLDRDAWRATLTPLPFAKLHRAWNALEDQRMETAVVSDSPRKAGYFTPMMLSELAETPEKASANWPLMVWRKYLPRKIRDGAKALFLAEHGPEMVRRIQSIVTRYVLAQTPVDMYMAVIEMADVFEQITLAYDIGDAGHKRQRSKGGTPQPGDFDIPVDPSMEDENEAEEDENEAEGAGQPSKGDSKGDKAEDSKGATGGDDADEDDADEAEDSPEGEAHGPGPIPEGGATGSHKKDDAGHEPKASKDEAEGDESDAAGDEAEDDDEELTQEDLNEALAEAEDERLKDSALDQDVQSFHNAKADTASGLEPYVGGIQTDPLQIAEANNLAEDIKRSFEAATVDLSPTWHEQQRRGIINVLRYETRQAGDVEFFRAFVDNGAPGCDIAVSVLLDYSGSMGGSVEALAKVAYACKRAAQDIGIPCTVTLWDTDARVLWDASETVDHLPTIVARGGTNPAIALDDLDAQTFGKTKHVVIIMTDDAWNNGAPTLAAYKAEGRLIIGLGYSEGYRNEHMVASMERKGADFAYAIEDLAEIPRHLEQALIAVA